MSFHLPACNPRSNETCTTGGEMRVTRQDYMEDLQLRLEGKVSVRTFKALSRAPYMIKSPINLVSKSTDRELLCIYGIGKFALEEIRKIIPSPEPPIQPIYSSEKPTIRVQLRRKKDLLAKNKATMLQGITARFRTAANIQKDRISKFYRGEDVPAERRMLRIVGKDFAELRNTQKRLVDEFYSEQVDLISAFLLYIDALRSGSENPMPVIWDLNIMKTECLLPLATFVIARYDSSISSISIREGQEEDFRRAMVEVFSSLLYREQSILVHRWGLDGTKRKTLDQTKVNYGVTRERIRQIEAKAMRKLCHPVRTKVFKKYLDIQWSSDDENR